MQSIEIDAQARCLDEGEIDLRLAAADLGPRRFQFGGAYPTVGLGGPACMTDLALIVGVVADGAERGDGCNFPQHSHG